MIRSIKELIKEVRLFRTAVKLLTVETQGTNGAISELIQEFKGFSGKLSRHLELVSSIEMKKAKEEEYDKAFKEYDNKY